MNDHQIDKSIKSIMEILSYSNAYVDEQVMEIKRNRS